MNDRFDELLNDTLQPIAHAEPVHGLEDRIHARATRTRRVRRLMWFATPVAACAAMAMVWIALHTTQPVMPQKMAVDAAPALQPAPVTHPDTPVVKAHVFKPATIAVRPRQEAVAQNDLPKLATFPAPPEDTTERRAIMALVEAKNQPALLAASDLKAQQAGPIEIAEIHIQPLSQETPQ